jgi:hypothetical protein
MKESHSEAAPAEQCNCHEKDTGGGSSRESKLLLYHDWPCWCRLQRGIEPKER